MHRLGLFRCREGEHLDLGELVDAVEAAAGAAVGAGLRAEAVGEPGEAYGEFLVLYYLVGKGACERYLGGGDQREVRVLDGVDLGLGASWDEACSDEMFVARQIRGDGRLVAMFEEDVHRVPDEPELQKNRVPAQKVELAPRHLRPRFEIYDTQGVTELDVVLDVEVELRDLTPAPDLHVLRVIFADGRVGVGNIGDLQLLFAQALLYLSKLRFLLRDVFLHGPRLLDEPLARI